MPSVSFLPSTLPSYIPSLFPSQAPSLIPIAHLSMAPSVSPSPLKPLADDSSFVPSLQPSAWPSNSPSVIPSATPSVSMQPSRFPIAFQSARFTVVLNGIMLARTLISSEVSELEVTTMAYLNSVITDTAIDVSGLFLVIQSASSSSTSERMLQVAPNSDESSYAATFAAVGSCPENVNFNEYIGLTMNKNAYGYLAHLQSNTVLQSFVQGDDLEPILAQEPSVSPSDHPTISSQPSCTPSDIPNNVPSGAPSTNPSDYPSHIPSWVSSISISSTNNPSSTSDVPTGYRVPSAFDTAHSSVPTIPLKQSNVALLITGCPPRELNATEIDSLIDTTFEFLPIYLPADKGINVTEVTFVLQKLSLGTGTRLLEEVGGTDAMIIYQKDAYANNHAKNAEHLDSSLSIIFAVIADCPSEVEFHSEVEATLKDNVKVYEHYVKEHSVLGLMPGSYFHVADEFEVLENPSAKPSSAPSSAQILENSANASLDEQYTRVTLYFGAMSENNILSNEAFASLEETTLSFLNTDEIVAFATEQIEMGSTVDVSTSISITNVDVLEQHGKAFVVSITGEYPIGADFNEIMISVFKDEANLDSYEILMEDSNEAFSSSSLKSDGSIGIVLIETPSQVPSVAPSGSPLRTRNSNGSNAGTDVISSAALAGVTAAAVRSFSFN